MQADCRTSITFFLFLLRSAIIRRPMVEVTVTRRNLSLMLLHALSLLLLLLPLLFIVACSPPSSRVKLPPSPGPRAV